MQDAETMRRGCEAPKGNAKSLTPEAVAKLVGGVFVRWPLPCDFCKANPKLREPTWLAFWSVGKGRTMMVCRDAYCLSEALEMHCKEQARADALVEAVPHGDHALASAATPAGRRAA